LPRRSRKSTPHTFDYTNQTEATYWSVFHQILRGGFRPGANVNPQLMADKLGVSLGTVRQALDWLTRDGLLVRLPRRGWQFVSPSWDEVVDTVQLRVMLESESIHRACARVQPEVLDQLEAETNRILESVNDVAEWDRRQADYFFHRTLAEQSGSSILTEMLDPLIRRSMFVGVSYPIGKPHATRAFLEHRHILNSLRKKDETAALQCLHTHITRWLNAMLSQHDPETLAKIAASSAALPVNLGDRPEDTILPTVPERESILSH
jgi:DNA-binding GntR family transcriptional regulator